MFSTALKNCVLFNSLSKNEIERILLCLNAKKYKFEKNSFIWTAGKKTENIGIVVRGSITIIKEDYWGNRTVIAKSGVGSIFGESYAAAGLKLPISVIAATECEIMFIDYKKIINPCSSVCSFHTSLIQNMLSTIAEKNIMMNAKTEHLLKRNIREKVLSYLSSLAVGSDSPIITIPFSRQELADYLFVDRSALSRELSRMKDEKIIDYNKNTFKLFQ